MKRLFLILCLITICNISYADIASVGYVDSVIDSLPAVAKTGSYDDLSNKPTNISSFTNDSGYITTSYHDSTKQDKLPTGPTDGKKYSLIWNGNGFVFKEFIEQSVALQCDASNHLYDIGFDQCVNGDYPPDSHTYEFGANTWTATFSYGSINGIASCNYDIGGESGVIAVPGKNYSQSDKGDSCWCKMIEPAESSWVYIQSMGDNDKCMEECPYACGESKIIRYGMFYTAGK